jgi:hypothetical protein
MDDPDLKLLAGIIIVIVLGAAAWYYWDEVFAPTVPEAPASLPLPAEPVTEDAPRYPMPEPQRDRTRGELVPLPSLDDSDSYFLLEIENTLGEAVAELFVRQNVIDRLVSSIDNLPRSKIPNQIRPVGTLDAPFKPDTAEDRDTLVLGMHSAARYDALVAYLYYADIDTVYDAYQRFYPLFQKAYERLGYPDAYFNDRLVEVVDHLLATPEPEGPIILVRPNVLYEFADPELEALSSGQKLMLRMGSDNAATMKRLLEKFRNRLTS